MKYNDVEQRKRICVWFNADDEIVFNTLDLSIPFHKFVKNSFYEAIDKKRLEK